MRRLSKLLLCLTTLFFTYPLLAESVIFSCMTKNNKQIKVIDKGNTFQYSFGKVGKPELVFANSKAQVKEQSPAWNGMGRYITSHMVMKNGQHLYKVYSQTDRLTDEHETEVGLDVWRGDKHLSNILCSQQHEIIFEIDAFNDYLN